MYMALMSNLRERNYLEDLGVGGENNIKVDLQELGWDMDWIDLVQFKDIRRAVVNAVMNLPVPYNAGKFLTS
jgi:hypothetical protein